MLIDERPKVNSTLAPSEPMGREGAHETAVMQQGKALLQKQALEALLGKRLTIGARLDLAPAIPHD